ncbi:MAG TPA: endonuclease/exonuclease/phosphatase family protein [Pirellulales bacterium]|nr:endonuclease/exonuclease/phosphatase family protein [Pirellulales bacterium]
MRKPRYLLPLLVALVASWFGFSKQARTILDRLGIGGGDPNQVKQSEALPLPPIARQGNSLRIASFNIQVFGEHKLDKPDIAAILAEVIRHFDVVAIQEIRAQSQDLLPRFIAMINAEGAHYDYVIGPRLGRTSSKEQYAFIYNAASLECDRESVYTVNDPDDLLHREPLVAGFRVRGPPPSEAFTFTLIDIHTDPDEVAKELSVLDDVMRAVAQDGRGEDDVILLGDLNADDRHFGELGQTPHLAWAISGRATNTRGNKLYDNIIFDSRATTEYLGQGGVVDMMREFNLSMQQALAVSDHLPIWAEFTLHEGGQPGRVAVRSGAGATSRR